VLSLSLGVLLGRMRAADAMEALGRHVDCLVTPSAVRLKRGRTGWVH
jgi:hypothetical protein